MVGKVVALWRFPFKSMLGEQVESLRFSPRGAEHDRLFALRDETTGKLLTARQCPQLLAHRATVKNGLIVITNGDQHSIDPKDGALLERFEKISGRKLSLATAFEPSYPKGLFDQSPILVSTVQSLESLAKESPASKMDPRRFRANVWIDAAGAGDYPEQNWLNKEIALGENVVLKPTTPCPRCVITTMQQEDLPTDHAVLKTISQVQGGVLGIYCAITSGGTIKVGDQVRVAG